MNKSGPQTPLPVLAVGLVVLVGLVVAAVLVWGFPTPQRGTNGLSTVSSGR